MGAILTTGSSRGMILQVTQLALKDPFVYPKNPAFPLYSYDLGRWNGMDFSTINPRVDEILLGGWASQD